MVFEFLLSPFFKHSTESTVFIGPHRHLKDTSLTELLVHFYESRTKRCMALPIGFFRTAPFITLAHKKYLHALPTVITIALRNIVRLHQSGESLTELQYSESSGPNAPLREVWRIVRYMLYYVSVFIRETLLTRHQTFPINLFTSKCWSIAIGDHSEPLGNWEIVKAPPGHWYADPFLIFFGQFCWYSFDKYLIIFLISFPISNFEIFSTSKKKRLLLHSLMTIKLNTVK